MPCVCMKCLSLHYFLLLDNHTFPLPSPLAMSSAACAGHATPACTVGQLN